MSKWISQPLCYRQCFLCSQGELTEFFSSLYSFFFGTYSGHAPFLPKFRACTVLDTSTPSDLAATCPYWSHAY